MNVKITVIGGGSSMFVPGLVRRLIEIPCFDGAELRLMDVDAARAGVMEQLAAELAAAEGRKLTVSSTTDQRAALRGTDFVIVAISVGGMKAWASDIEIPGRHGVFMHIADSIGPGGIFRALRNTPVVASVAKDVSELAPDATVLNYTNPASANAIAMAKVSPVRSLSLCSCSPRPYQRAWLAELTGVPEEDVLLPVAVGGINHCTGMMSLQLRDGRDAIPLVRQRTDDDIVRWAIDTFGVVPYCSGHWVEFFPQLQRLQDSYSGRAQGLAMRYDTRIFDMDKQLERVRSWEEIAAAWRLEGGRHRLADLPHGPEDDGIIVAELMQAIIEDRGERFIVNVINHGLIPNLPSSAAVEVPAVVDATGVHPAGIGPIPTGLAAVLSRHAQVQELTAEAALTGDKATLCQVMTADPLLDALLEPPQIQTLLDEMLAANAPMLPNFFGQGAGTRS
jgi:alpha-galactosidase/6-phospho-beta-glucosidase family protein